MIDYTMYTYNFFIQVGRRQMPPNGPRDFYNQRFGPPGMNGVPMNMMRGTMQQFGRNNNPMFMWQPRPGLFFKNNFNFFKFFF